MKSRNPFLAIKNYSFEKRRVAGKIGAAQKLVRGKKNHRAILLIGYGGTISSGYTPTKETIVPLHPSPAIKQIEYMNLFGTSNLQFEHADLLAKDSRYITSSDLETLLDVLNLVPHKKILITAGTYMLPKIACAIIDNCHGEHKVIALTGSILPAGFVASDADANIWSALSILNYKAVSSPSDTGVSVIVVFHGRVFEKRQEIQKLNLHPKKMRDLVIQYPLTTVPTNNAL